MQIAKATRRHRERGKERETKALQIETVSD